MTSVFKAFKVFINFNTNFSIQVWHIYRAHESIFGQTHNWENY